MRRVCWLTVFAGLLVAGGQVVRSNEGRPRNKTGTRSLPDVVATVLEETRRSGSLAYGWTCVESGDFSDPFRASVPLGEGGGVQRLHTAFANEPSLRVTEYPSGLIRVVGGTLKSDLLALKIERIVFRN